MWTDRFWLAGVCLLLGCWRPALAASPDPGASELPGSPGTSFSDETSGEGGRPAHDELAAQVRRVYLEEGADAALLRWSEGRCGPLAGPEGSTASTGRSSGSAPGASGRSSGSAPGASGRSSGSAPGASGPSSGSAPGASGLHARPPGAPAPCDSDAARREAVLGAFHVCPVTADQPAPPGCAGLPGLLEGWRALAPESPWRAAWGAFMLQRACFPRREPPHVLPECAEVLGALSGGVTLAAGALQGPWPVTTWLGVRSRVVGVLLPLSGEHAHVGAGARDALQLAFEGVDGVSLVFRDTAGDAARAAELVRELASVERVVGLIGPVGRLETAAAVAVSRQLGLPHVVLASQLGRGASPPGLLDPAVRVRTSPEELARAVARHAILEVGLRRIAVVGPEEAEGQASASAVARQVAAFVAEVERLGGTAGPIITYPADTRDFRAAAEALLPPSARGRRAAPGTPAFDGLFIPDSAARVRRLVPFLEYAGLTPRTRPGGPGVQLLGAAGWHHPTVIDRTAGLTDNAIFADVWQPSADEGPVGPDGTRSIGAAVAPCGVRTCGAAGFARRFEAATRVRPGPFHAEVFDAARLLARAVSGLPADDQAAGGSAGPAARGALLARLLTQGPEEGVTGVLAFTGGDPVPRTHLLTVHGESLRGRVSEAEEGVLRATPGPSTPLPVGVELR